MTDLQTIDAPDDLKDNVAACVAWSQSNAIVTADHFAETADHLKDIKGAMKRADEFFDPPIKQAFELHRMLVARKKIITEPLKQSEAIDKQKMLSYQQAEQKKADDERRRLQAIADEKARKEREIAEQAAAKQRAIEAEQRQKAEQARREAEQASAAERKRLLDEAARAERAASAALAKQQAQEDKAAAVVAPVIRVETAAPKAVGVSIRKTWKAEIVDQSKFMAAACENKRYDLLLPNEKMLDNLAKGMREQASFPGVKFYEEAGMSSRSK